MTKEELQNLIEEGLDGLEYAQVIKICTQDGNLYPNEVSYYCYMGLAYLLQGDELEAKNIWLSILLEDESGEHLAELIAILEKEVIGQIGKHNLFLAKYITEQIQAIEEGYVNQEIENIEEARECYEIARTIEPKNSEVIKNLELLEKFPTDNQLSPLDSEDNFDENLLFQKPKRVSFYINLANCFIALGEKEKALDIYTLGIKYHPRNTLLMTYKIILLQELKPVQEAINTAKEALMLMPDDLLLKLELMRIMPLLYESSSEIEDYRYNYESRNDLNLHLVRTVYLLVL